MTTMQIQMPVTGERQRGIDRLLALLEALMRLRGPARVGDLAKEIGAPRSTTYEIVNRLLEAQILEPVGDDGLIYFGRTLHLYGHAYADANAFHRRCRDALDRLTAETGATTQLCALRGNKYVALDARDGGGLFRITSTIGAEVPIPWTASGRLLLDHMTAEEIRAFIPPEDYRLPDGRVLTEAEFLADIARARAEGISITTGLADRFTCCLAAPIRNRDGVATATLCFVIPADVPAARRDELVRCLLREVETLR
jgi:DNA-binding IclR family transcriptional regulator